ncbi:MAG: hypothetical protein HOM84_06390 [Thiotrichales bacterium]|nr:hypothetical protein [Thiotrichales bacterium]MBT3613587.1 hypothetical protein [Thiotrichales bacterium]MBT3753319.1 hypothetical protein [Thiotrichales bacterium]MBT3837236.1 hypothetical protein [Thiotrichales bacterium]MBT4574297.1 hypothetical protein [Thiotrichales bacterium]
MSLDARQGRRVIHTIDDAIGGRVSATNRSRVAVFQKIISNFSEDRRIDIMDLARPIEKNIEFFLDYNARLHYPDFTYRLLEMREEQRELDSDELNDELSSGEGNGIQIPSLLPELIDIDYAFIWDLPQYLTRSELKELALQLGDVIKRGGYLYLINSTQAKIAPEPMHCRIMEDGYIKFDGMGKMERISPLYSQLDIKELMRGFSITSSSLLQNGLQEIMLIKD